MAVLFASLALSGYGCVYAANDTWLTEEERIYGLSLIWRHSAEMSAFLAQTPEDFDWNALYLEYIPRVIAAQDMVEYYEVLSRFTANLHDGKSAVMFPDGYFFSFVSPISVRYIEGSFIVYAVNSSFTDIPVGSEIMSVDGSDAKVFLEEYMGDILNLHTPLAREDRLSMLFRATRRPIEMSLEVVTPDGEEMAEVIRFISSSRQTDPIRNRDIALSAMYPGGESISLEDGAYAQVHEGNLHRIIIPHFQSDNISESVLQYLEEVAETAQGFILDVRGNMGGSTDIDILLQFIDPRELNMFSAYRQVRDARHMAVATAIMAFDFVPDDLWDQYEQGRPFYHGRLMLESRHLEPLDFNGITDMDDDMIDEMLAEFSLGLFDVPVVILADYATASAGDDFVAFADGVDRFTIIGTNTMGSTGQLAVFSLPGGGTFNLTTNLMLSSEGRQLNNYGIAPDIWVEQGLADLLDGRDTQLIAALEYLTERIAE